MIEVIEHPLTCLIDPEDNQEEMGVTRTLASGDSLRVLFSRPENLSSLDSLSKCDPDLHCAAGDGLHQAVFQSSALTLGPTHVYALRTTARMPIQYYQYCVPWRDLVRGTVFAADHLHSCSFLP